MDEALLWLGLLGRR